MPFLVMTGLSNSNQTLSSVQCSVLDPDPSVRGMNPDSDLDMDPSVNKQNSTVF
jgi:hypothetical protein